MLRYARDQFPARTAVVCGNDRFTYGQLAERVSKLAGALREMGVQKGDRVALIGFGTFKVASRKARMGVNPKTGEKIKIKASKTVKFSVGKDLKSKLK